MEHGQMKLPDGTVIGYVILPRRRFLLWTLWTTVFVPSTGIMSKGSWNFLFRRSARAKLGKMAGEMIDAAEAKPVELPTTPPPGFEADPMN